MRIYNLAFALMIFLLFTIPTSAALSPIVKFPSGRMYVQSSNGSVNNYYQTIGGNTTQEIWAVCNNGTFQTGSELDTQRGNSSSEMRLGVNGTPHLNASILQGNAVCIGSDCKT